jgi:hypothetical protein
MSQWIGWNNYQRIEFLLDNQNSTISISAQGREGSDAFETQRDSLLLGQRLFSLLFGKIFRGQGRIGFVHQTLHPTKSHIPSINQNLGFSHLLGLSINKHHDFRQDLLHAILRNLLEAVVPILGGRGD